MRRKNKINMNENKKLKLLETKSDLDDNFTANIQKG